MDEYRSENILQKTLPGEREKIIKTEITENIKANIHLAKTTITESKGRVMHSTVIVTLFKNTVNDILNLDTFLG